MSVWTCSEPPSICSCVCCQLLRLNRKLEEMEADLNFWRSRSISLGRDLRESHEARQKLLAILEKHRSYTAFNLQNPSMYSLPEIPQRDWEEFLKSTFSSYEKFLESKKVT